MKKVKSIIPGFALAIFIAIVAKFIENILPMHIIGGSVIALFIGMALNNHINTDGLLKDGIKFTSKRLLKFAIILLGASLNDELQIILRHLNQTKFVHK